jgi:hypothetical protein
MTQSARGSFLVPVDPHSTLNWEGLHPERFNYNQKKHYESKDEMKSIQGKDVPLMGRRHFDPTFGLPKQSKYCMKVYPDKMNRESARADEAHNVKKIEYIPVQKRYGHKEKMHGTTKESGHFNFNRTSVKTFDVANALSNKSSNLEKEMGIKKNMDYHEDQRNGLGLTSLGDKSYKNPEYSSNFFHEGGLVAGSSMRDRPAKPDSYTLPKHIKFPLYPDRVTWKDKEKIDQVRDEKKAVKELDEWEQTTLKESNPNWRDPDKFEFDMPKKVDPKLDPKNQKKAAKK